VFKKEEPLPGINADDINADLLVAPLAETSWRSLSINRDRYLESAELCRRCDMLKPGVTQNLGTYQESSSASKMFSAPYMI
jgi:hypothetical protein